MPLTHILDRSHSVLAMCTSMKSGEAMQVICAQTSSLSEMVWLCKLFPRKLNANRVNSSIRNIAIILKIMHNIFNRRDTEVVLLNKADVFNHYLNIR